MNAEDEKLALDLIRKINATFEIAAFFNKLPGRKCSVCLNFDSGEDVVTMVIFENCSMYIIENGFKRKIKE